MTDIEARKRHQPDRPGGFQSCDTCMERVDYEHPEPVPWPCDTATSLADADALAEALEWMLGTHDLYTYRGNHDYHSARAALAAHRARKP